MLKSRHFNQKYNINFIKLDLKECSIAIFISSSSANSYTFPAMKINRTAAHPPVHLKNWEKNSAMPNEPLGRASWLDGNIFR